MASPLDAFLIFPYNPGQTWYQVHGGDNVMAVPDVISLR